MDPLPKATLSGMEYGQKHKKCLQQGLVGYDLGDPACWT